VRHFFTAESHAPEGPRATETPGSSP